MKLCPEQVYLIQFLKSVPSFQVGICTVVSFARGILHVPKVQEDIADPVVNLHFVDYERPGRDQEINHEQIKFSDIMQDSDINHGYKEGVEDQPIRLQLGCPILHIADNMDTETCKALWDYLLEENPKKGIQMEELWSAKHFCEWVVKSVGDKDGSSHAAGVRAKFGLNKKLIFKEVKLFSKGLEAETGEVIFKDDKPTSTGSAH